MLHYVGTPIFIAPGTTFPEFSNEHLSKPKDISTLIYIPVTNNPPRPKNVKVSWSHSGQSHAQSSGCRARVRLSPSPARIRERARAVISRTWISMLSASRVRFICSLFADRPPSSESLVYPRARSSSARVAFRWRAPRALAQRSRRVYARNVIASSYLPVKRRSFDRRATMGYRAFVCAPLFLLPLLSPPPPSRSLSLYNCSFFYINLWLYIFLFLSYRKILLTGQ